MCPRPETFTFYGRLTKLTTYSATLTGIEGIHSDERSAASVFTPQGIDYTPSVPPPDLLLSYTYLHRPHHPPHLTLPHLALLYFVLLCKQRIC